MRCARFSVIKVSKDFITTNFVIKVIALSIAVLNITLIIKLMQITKKCSNKENYKPCNLLPLWEQTINFTETVITNETGTKNGCFLVPNYIHFIRFGLPYISYVDMICILSAFKNQKPDKIFIHRNHNTSFIGKYWDILTTTPGFLDILELVYLEQPREIFGQKVDNEYKQQHSSDFTRLRILIKYGGIFIDNDSYIVNSLDVFRRYEMTLNWDENQYLGCQLLIAHKDARFLKLWLESYRGQYNKNRWYFNAGEHPTKSILWKHPELIHRVKVLFGADTKFAFNLYQQMWPHWKNFYALHLLINHQYLLHDVTSKAKFPVVFNETNIVNYPVTFREMAYDVYDVANIKWPKLHVSPFKK